MITGVPGTYPSQYNGLSTDDKNSIKDPVNSSIFWEFDLGNLYVYNKDGKVWIKQ